MPLRRITHHGALIFTVLGPLLFWVAAIFADPGLLRNIFNSMAFGVCTVVAVLWFIPMYEELRHRGKEAPAGAWVIVLGIFFWSFTLAWQRMFAMVLLYMGYPLWLQEGPLAAFVPFSIMWGGILFLAAIAMNRPTAVPSRMSMFYILIAVAIGAFAAGYVGARALPF